MYNVKLYNKISKVGLNDFDTEKYTCSEDFENYDAVLVRSAKLHEVEFPADLKCIARAGAGVNNIPIDRCSKEGIVVFNTPGANANAVKELVICALLLASRKVVQGANWVKSLKGTPDIGPAAEKGKSTYAGPEIAGKKLGIIGLGAIGVKVANAAVALDMEVWGYDPFLSVDGALKLDRSVKHVTDLNEIFANCDYITIHVPLNADTKNTISAEAIEKMKDGVRVINLARGELVDTKAMAKALESGKVAAYVSDFASDEILEQENAITLPHLGASTIEAQIGVAVDVAYGVIDALEGRPVMTAVNMAPIPKSVATVIQPYFKLAERMGTVGIYLADGPIKSVEVEYTGALAETETQALTTAFLKGLLNPILQESVNFVNAPGIAKKRNLEVKEVKANKPGYFTTAINVKIATAKGTHKIEGTLFDGKQPKIVQIDQYHVDFNPEGYLLLAPHVNKPNMIGQMATILGSAGININGMQVGSTPKSDTNIMAIAVGDDIPNDIMLQLRGVEGIIDVKLINCEG